MSIERFHIISRLHACTCLINTMSKYVYCRAGCWCQRHTNVSWWEMHTILPYETSGNAFRLAIAWLLAMQYLSQFALHTKACTLANKLHSTCKLHEKSNTTQWFWMKPNSCVGCQILGEKYTSQDIRLTSICTQKQYSSAVSLCMQTEKEFDMNIKLIHQVGFLW